MPYSVIIDEIDAKKQFLALDKSIRIHVLKKIKQMERDDVHLRHLKFGLPDFVEEVGQYRICFRIQDKIKEKRIIFMGDHKEYEKWCRKQLTKQ